MEVNVIDTCLESILDHHLLQGGSGSGPVVQPFRADIQMRAKRVVHSPKELAICRVVNLVVVLQIPRLLSRRVQQLRARHEHQVALVAMKEVPVARCLASLEKGRGGFAAT